MRINHLGRIMLMCMVLLNFLNVSAISTTGFTSGNWWQAAGYAGLGNQNEELAFAEFTVPSGQTDVTVKFKLQGSYSTFINRVCLYARKYDSSTAGNSSSIAKTFEQPWDYRDPVSKSGAILLSQTSNISGNEMTLQGSGLSAGDYVFYITGDIADNLEKLPAIKGSEANFTRVGAQFTSISSGTSSASLSQQFFTSSATANADGMRVLVPQLRTLYAPGDYYSKYYRIPALVTAADGALVAVSDARKNHIHDITNDIDMLSRRSKDNGRIWSEPITIAKGDSASKTMYSEYASSSSKFSVIDCSESKGYGDAALASLANGDLICTFIHGYGFGNNSSSKLSTNSYVVSRDNGQTWGSIKDMCDASGTALKVITSYRGCIAPGNLCTVKKGYLAGKVIGCFRTVRTVSSSSNNHCGNYFLTYDPDNDAWNMLSNSASVTYSADSYTDSNFFYQNSATSGNGTDDESQLIELSENTFLMSIRSSGTNHREFAIIKLQKNGNNIYWQATALNNCGMSLDVDANGTMCHYNAMTDGEEVDYLLHTVPTSQASASSGDNTTTRSSLTLYSTKSADVSTDGFTWTKSLNVSDPDNSLDETAQYSSITVQQDGTIGILYENYPQVVRVNPAVYGSYYTSSSWWSALKSDVCQASGDYMLRTQYINLRIEDIIPEATTIQRENLSSPIVTPQAQVYDIKDKSTWKNIVIKNPNPEGVSKTNYSIEVLDADGKQVLNITEDCIFEGDSITLNWDEGKMIQVADSIKDSGYAVRISAKCFVTDDYKDEYNSPSTVASQIYYFKYPLYRVTIKALPYTNSGDPTMSTSGITVAKDVQLIVSENDVVTLYGGYGNEPFTFDGFSTSESESQKGVIDSEFNPTKITDNQYTITIPVGYAGNDIVIYAWYKSPKIGVKTRVNTNYFNGNADGISWVGDKQVLVHKYEYSDWCTNENYISTYEWANCAPYAGIGKPQFPSFVPDGTDLSTLNFADKEVADAVADSYDLYYPTGNIENDYHKFGVDLTARVMSDTTTLSNYNVVVMVKKDDAYMTKADVADNAQQSLVSLTSSDKAPVATSPYYYYVVNGFAYPFGEGEVLNNASGVYQWYSASSSVTPAVSEAMTFSNLIDKQGSETPVYKVVFFIVNKNTLSSVDKLIAGSDYVFKVEHEVHPNSSKTGVDDVDMTNGLVVVGKTGCATFTSNQGQVVNVYNVLGQQMCSFNLDGSYTVELPQGVYVANGQKFIVK